MKLKKIEALRLFTEHIVPDRWQEVRLPNPNELKATTGLALPLTEASAKIRSGNPVDDAEDYALEVWAGVLPFEMQTGDPLPDDSLKPEIALPNYIAGYRRKKIKGKVSMLTPAAPRSEKGCVFR